MAGSGHIGDRVAAFVDGELSDGARERVLAHLAGCPACRAAAEAERAAKRWVAELGIPRPAVAPSPDLVTALLSIGNATPKDPPFGDGGPTSGGDPSILARSPWSLPRGWRPPTERRSEGLSTGQDSTTAARTARPLRSRMVTVGAFGVAVATFGTAFMLGMGDAPASPMDNLNYPASYTYPGGPASVQNARYVGSDGTTELMALGAPDDGPLSGGRVFSDGGSSASPSHTTAPSFGSGGLTAGTFGTSPHPYWPR